MGLTVDLNGVRDVYGLCFVRSPWAYFTRESLDQQWGDGWERSPYEEFAGDPYNDRADQILKLAFDGPLLTPDMSDTGKLLDSLDDRSSCRTAASNAMHAA
jgi:hypothetical protein